MRTYTVLIGVENDTTGKHFEPSAIITDADFPLAILAEWVALRVIAENVSVDEVTDSSTLSTEKEGADDGR